MSKRLISSGSDFEKVAGYSRAVVDDDYVHVAGTTGFDYTKMSTHPAPLVKCRQFFRNIARAWERGGSRLDEVVRVNYSPTEAPLLKKGAPFFGEFSAGGGPGATA